MNLRSLFSYDFSWQLLPTLKCFRSLGIRLCLFRQIAGDLSGFSYVYIYIHVYILEGLVCFDNCNVMFVCGLEVLRL